MQITAEGLDWAAREVLRSLLDGTWRGIALTLGVALLLRAVPAAGAATRHAVWWAALGLVAALPLLPVAPVGLAPPPGGGAPAAVWSVPSPPGRWPLAILALLAVVAVLRLARVAVGVWGVLRLKRSSLPLRAPAAEALAGALPAGLPRRARVRESARVSTPVALGLGRPAVLLPSSLVDDLEGEELLQVTLHELAHLRRRDDWGILAQRVVEALLWFHPAVRWIGARLELEREIACDDEVVARTGSRGYARCLTRLARLAVESRRAALTPGVAPGRSHLARRIGALLAPRTAVRPRASRLGFALSVALLVGATAAMQRLAPALELALPRMELTPVLRAALVSPLPVGRGEPSPARAAVVSAAPVEAPWEDERLALLDAAAPEPRVVAGCAPAECGGAEIMERAAPAPLAPRAGRVARGPAPPPQRARREGPALEVTLSLPGTPEMALRPSLAPVGEMREARGWGGPFRLRVLGGGSRWQPHSMLAPRW